MTGYVVLANLGADIDVGTQVANKLNIVPATTGVFGKMRFATAAEIATSAAGPVLDASQAVGVSNNQTISGFKVFASLSTTVPASLSGTVLQVVGSSSTVRLLLDAVGGAQGALTFRTAAGTQAAPAALAAGASLGVIQNYGYGATGYSSGARASLKFVTAEAWTDTAQGTNATINVTAPGTATSFAALTISGSGILTATASPAVGANGFDLATTGFVAGTVVTKVNKGRRNVPDANYQILATDYLVALTALTASRTLTLPFAASYDSAQVLYTLDETGLASSSLPVTVQAASVSTTANGATSASASVVVASPTNITSGQVVTGPGVANPTTVLSVSGTTVNLSQNATIANGGSLTFSDVVITGGLVGGLPITAISITQPGQKLTWHTNGFNGWTYA